MGTAAEQQKNRRGQHLGPHRFKKGQSGNPSGRPKGSVSLITRLKQMLHDTPKQGEAFIRDLIQQARAGNAPYMREIMDRLEGKIPDELHVSGGFDLADAFTQYRQRSNHVSSNGNGNGNGHG